MRLIFPNIVTNNLQIYYLCNAQRHEMTKDTENIFPRVFLFRLIPDATTSRFRNEKREEQVRRRQKELVARQLMDKFSDEQTAVVCDDPQQGSSMCLYVYDSTDTKANRSLLSNFLAGTLRQLAFCNLPGLDFTPICPTYIFIVSAKTTEEELADCLKRLIENPHTTIFLLFHIMSSDEWLISSAIEGIDPKLMTMYDVPVTDNSNPEKPEDEQDYDRVKTYTLPFNGSDATYKFMWNDGYTGVYYKVEQLEKIAEEGYRYDTTLLELLNKEFSKPKPSKKLASHISDVFDSQDDFEVIAER